MIDLELLDYDLQEHVCEDNMILHHPLVILDLRFKGSIAKANAMYESKTSRISEAVDKHDWKGFVWPHERPYRPDAVMQLIEEFGVSGKQLWPVVGEVWCDTENVRHYFNFWRKIWSMDDADRPLVMSDEERAALALLPERFEIWRGVNHEDAVRGYSWTLNRERATWYAHRRFKGLPLLAIGSVKKADVLAHFLGRDEAEIVALSENVQDIRLSPLEQRASRSIPTTVLA
jgi:hypothetical protein